LKVIFKTQLPRPRQQIVARARPPIGDPVPGWFITRRATALKPAGQCARILSGSGTGNGIGYVVRDAHTGQISTHFLRRRGLFDDELTITSAPVTPANAANVHALLSTALDRPRLDPFGDATLVLDRMLAEIVRRNAPRYLMSPVVRIGDRVVDFRNLVLSWERTVGQQHEIYLRHPAMNFRDCLTIHLRFPVANTVVFGLSDGDGNPITADDAPVPPALAMCLQTALSSSQPEANGFERGLLAQLAGMAGMN
jgi:hypothetical protein